LPDEALANALLLMNSRKRPTIADLLNFTYPTSWKTVRLETIPEK
jgi:hypothetical protein